MRLFKKENYQQIVERSGSGFLSQAFEPSSNPRVDMLFVTRTGLHSDCKMNMNEDICDLYKKNKYFIKKTGLNSI